MLTQIFFNETGWKSSEARYNFLYKQAGRR